LRERWGVARRRVGTFRVWEFGGSNSSQVKELQREHAYLLRRGRAPLVFATRNVRTFLKPTFDEKKPLLATLLDHSGHRRALERTRAPDPYKTIFQWLRA
jgi:hypothetical protein